ncbi:MAG: TetR/AcrR family transcriptional regulator, partial [Proteobacteria bacterium]
MGIHLGDITDLNFHQLLYNFEQNCSRGALLKSDQNNRKRVHQAALQLFVEKDGKELSVSELAKRAGVARGTIYN